MEETIIYRDFHYEDGRQAGMKEVIDWLEENAYPSSSEYFCFNRGDLHEQEKKWGIIPSTNSDN